MGLLHRNKPQPQEDTYLEDAVTHAAVQTRRTASEQEERSNKGIDSDMIDPQEIIEKLEELAYEEVYETHEMQAKDEKGEFLYQQIPATDATGNTVYNMFPVKGSKEIIKQPVMVTKPILNKVVVQKTVQRVWAIAVLGYLNKVWPTICMTPYEADTTKIRIRSAFYKIRKSMAYEEKRKYGVILLMAQDLCLARCEDMKDAQKALLLKVQREDLRVHLNKSNPAIGGGK